MRKLTTSNEPGRVFKSISIENMSLQTSSLISYFSLRLMWSSNFMLIMRDTYSKYTGSQFSPDRSPQLHRVCFAKINRWEMRGHDHNRDNLTPKDVNILCLHELLLLRAETAHTEVLRCEVWGVRCEVRGVRCEVNNGNVEEGLRPISSRTSLSCPPSNYEAGWWLLMVAGGLFFPYWISLCNLYWTTGSRTGQARIVSS